MNYVAQSSDGSWIVVVNGREVGSYPTQQEAERAFNTATGQSNAPSPGAPAPGGDGTRYDEDWWNRYNIGQIGSNQERFDEMMRQFNDKLAENKRQFERGLYSNLSQSLLSGATGLRGPANWLDYSTFTGGGKSIFKSLFGDQPNPSFSAPTGVSPAITIEDILKDLGLLGGTSRTGASGGLQQAQGAEVLGPSPQIAGLGQRALPSPQGGPLGAALQGGASQQGGGLLPSSPQPIPSWQPGAPLPGPPGGNLRASPLAPVPSMAQESGGQPAPASTLSTVTKALAPKAQTAAVSPDGGNANSPYSDWMWSDTSRGLPQPDMRYAQILTPVNMDDPYEVARYINQNPGLPGTAPLPHQINPLVWDSLSPSDKQVVLASVGKGYTPSGAWDVEDYLTQMFASRPQGQAPSRSQFNWAAPQSAF